MKGRAYVKAWARLGFYARRGPRLKREDLRGLARVSNAPGMRVRVVLVGRDRNDPLIEASEVYLDRARHTFPVDVVEVKEAPLKKGASVLRVKAEEAERIKKVLEPGELVIVMDERGKGLTSVQVSDKFDRWMQEGLRSVAFVIGGPSGLHPDFMKQARERWALSTMTLPHRMARLILCEQIYRAVSILRGEPYHK